MCSGHLLTYYFYSSFSFFLLSGLNINFFPENFSISKRIARSIKALGNSIFDQIWLRPKCISVLSARVLVFSADKIFFNFFSSDFWHTHVFWLAIQLTNITSIFLRQNSYNIISYYCHFIIENIFPRFIANASKSTGFITEIFK